MPMDTLAERLETLEREGFREHFRVEPTGLRAVEDGRLFEPEELVTERILRFEGTSDPEDESVVFALATRDGLRGTLVTSFGPGVEPAVAEIVRRLPPPIRR